MVLGHLQALALPTAPAVLKSYSDNLKELRKRNVYVKVSGPPRSRPNADAPFDPAVYKAALEIPQGYFLAKGRAAAEKFFWKNSAPAFRWIRRDPKQPQLG